MNIQLSESLKKGGAPILAVVMMLLTGCMNLGHLVQEPAEKTFVSDCLRQAAENERKGDQLEALKHYKIALAMDSNNVDAAEGRNRVETSLRSSSEESYRRGLEAQKRGRSEEAQRDFLTALRLRPDYPEALERVMAPEEVPAKGPIVHKVRPGESLSQLALVYYGDPEKYQIIARYNNLRDAGLVRVGQEILIPEPDAAPIAVGGGGARAATGPQERGEAAETATEDGDPVSVYREQGVELFEERRFEEALAEFKKVLIVRPKDRVAREYSYRSSFEIAMGLLGNGEYLAARDQFKESQDYKTDCPQCDAYVKKSEDLYKEMHYKRGMQYYGKEQLTEAIMEWEMVKSVDPGYKRVSDYIEKARELIDKLEYLKMELEERSTCTGQNYLFLNRT